MHAPKNTGGYDRASPERKIIVTISKLVSDLARRTDAQGAIRIGLAGAGQMGTDIVVQVAQMHGLAISAIGPCVMRAT